MNISFKKLAIAASGIAMAASVAVPAFAQTTTDDRRPMIGRPEERDFQDKEREGNRGKDNRPAFNAEFRSKMMEAARQFNGRIFPGIVTGITGTTISAGHRLGTSTATTTFTVDASNAVIIKGKATTTIASIAIGDRIFVEGALSTSTNIVSAKFIYDGPAPMMGRSDDRIGSSTGQYRNDDHGRGDDNGKKIGFFRGVGNFFKGLFGFHK